MISKIDFDKKASGYADKRVQTTPSPKHQQNRTYFCLQNQCQNSTCTNFYSLQKL